MSTMGLFWFLDEAQNFNSLWTDFASSSQLPHPCLLIGKDTRVIDICHFPSEHNYSGGENVER